MDSEKEHVHVNFFSSNAHNAFVTNCLRKSIVKTKITNYKQYI